MDTDYDIGYRSDGLVLSNSSSSRTTVFYPYKPRSVSCTSPIDVHPTHYYTNTTCHVPRTSSKSLPNTLARADPSPAPAVPAVPAAAAVPVPAGLRPYAVSTTTYYIPADAPAFANMPSPSDASHTN